MHFAIYLVGSNLMARNQFLNNQKDSASFQSTQNAKGHYAEGTQV